MQKDAPELWQIDRQRASFDAKVLYYTEHHSDSVALAYRDNFFRDRVLSFDLTGKTVLDAMCAGGPDAEYLISRGAEVTGLDISPVAAALYTWRTGKHCKIGSMHATGFPSEHFDVVWLVAGLHHCLPLLPRCVEEIHRLLKPGGYFLSFEPNADTWADQLRKMWYGASEKFDESEAAISYKNEMRPLLSLGFVEELYFAGGNVGYLLAMNSGVLGLSLKLKRFLRLPLFWAERVLAPIPGMPQLYWCARWRRC